MDARRAEVYKLKLRGYQPHRIAEKLGVIPQIVSQDIEWNRVRIKNTSEVAKSDSLRDKIEQIHDVREQAWEAFEASFRSKKTKRTESVPIPQKKGKDGRKAPRMMHDTLVRIKEVVTLEGRLPSSEFLRIVLETLTAECKLLGLFPTEDDGKGKDGIVQVDWKEFYRPRITRVDVADPVEAEIAKVESLVPKPPSENGNGKH